MPVSAVVGAQWGDEGKGRVIDYFAQNADMVIRFQGGDNAGHTVINEFGTFRLHLVPSGIFNPATKCIVGAGTVVNPDSILREMHELTEAGVSLKNLWLSERANIVMPYHVLLDGLQEPRAAVRPLARPNAALGRPTATRPRAGGYAWEISGTRSGCASGWSRWRRARASNWCATANRR